MASTGDGSTLLSQSTSGDTVDYRAMVSQFHKQMGDARSMRPDKRARVLNEIYNLTGAKSSSDKTFVEAALVYIFIVHGASPNVEWSSIDLIAGGGTKPTPMADIVRVIDRKYIRKFATSYTSIALKMHDESPEIRDLLKERAVRSGLPITETRAMIDFANMNDENPLQAALRVRAKYGAVARAELSSNTDNSLGKASTNAVNKVGYVKTPRGNEDSLGPLE